MSEDRKQRALVDPAAVYAAPADVVHDEDLTVAERIDILRRWEYDAREIEVADEEGLANPRRSALLDRIIAALHELGSGPDTAHSPTTKHGGV